MAWPIWTTCPGSAFNVPMVPANGEGTSIVALSVITSSRFWPRLTVSPGATSQRTSSASLTPSPMCGSAKSMRASVGAYSRRLGGDLPEGGAHVLHLRHAVLFVDLVQPDAGDVRAGQEARADEQVVEVVVDHPPQQVLAEVRYLGVLVDDQHAAGLLHALADRAPVIREDAPQVD